jgi:hypothetical protein
MSRSTLTHRKDRNARPNLAGLGRRWVVSCLVALTSLAATPGVAGAEKPISTGAMIYAGDVIVDTECYVTNVGKKRVRISSVAIIDAVGSTTAASSDDCTTGPIAPNETCIFSGSAGVYGGGTAVVRGSTKNVRGRCKLSSSSDTFGTTLESADMR